MPDKNRIDEIQKMLRAAKLGELLDIMENLDNGLRDRVLDALAGTVSEQTKQQAMADIRSQLSDADEAVKQWTRQGISTAYVDAMNGTDNILREYNMRIGAERLTTQILREAPEMGAHRQAANALLRDAYLDFGSGMTGAVQSAEQKINDALRAQLRAQIAQGQVTGEGAEQVARRLKQTLSDDGFTALLDRGGKRWRLKNYTEMLARTHLIESSNEATMNRLADHNVDLVEISTHGATDQLCKSEEGKIYSLSGNHPDYDYLFNPPPFHPNCRHTLLPRPDLR